MSDDGRAMDAEVALAGGNSTTVVRVGSTVRRTAGAWTPVVHRLLGHLHDRGVTQVPQALGVDAAGREVLSFLPGTVGHAPLSPACARPAALRQAARLLRRLHDATAEVAPSWREGWQAPAVSPVEVICHGDFAPYNCVYDAGGRVVGVIDFDHAHPGPRAWDLAYAAYRFVPLMAPGNPEHRDTIEAQCGRLHAFLRAYGPVPLDGFADTLLARLQRMVDFLVEGAAAADPRWQAALARGDAHLYTDDRLHIEAHRAALGDVVASLPP